MMRILEGVVIIEVLVVNKVTKITAPTFFIVFWTVFDIYKYVIYEKKWSSLEEILVAIRLLTIWAIIFWAAFSLLEIGSNQITIAMLELSKYLIDMIEVKWYNKR